uniref:Menorin-like domain-containing protein n=1 Tax=Timema cristinae TaxID=61476 RepID=A0A7R9D0R7_TIMCR|nr:unnamed protein product [Timema cristinae]
MVEPSLKNAVLDCATPTFGFVAASVACAVTILKMASCELMPSVMDFFPSINDDLTKVTWAHAVNSEDDFNKALKDKVMMLEADVDMGRKGIFSFNKIPIMVHPPATRSDMSLKEFLNKVAAAKSVGAKLDLKSIEAVEESIKIIRDMIEKLKFPLWLNADILKGPVNSIIRPLDADIFLSLCTRNLPEATLSLGWTLFYAAPVIVPGKYEAKHITQMKDALTRNNVTQPVTFAVDASLAAQSLDTLPALMNIPGITDITLSVFLSQPAFVNISQLTMLIKTFGKDRVYVDLPESPEKLNSTSPLTFIKRVLNLVSVIANMI